MRIGRGHGGIVGVLLLVAVLLLTDLAEQRDSSGPAGGGADSGLGESAQVEVLRVVDGDTIEVALDGRTEDVRYIGVDTPETVKPGTPVQCFGEQASAFNKELVSGERVRLRFDRELRDRFGRLLAYVYVGSKLVNAELVRGGYARTLEIEPNTAMAEQLGRLELAAGEAGRGLWSAC